MTDGTQQPKFANALAQFIKRAVAAEFDERINDPNAPPHPPPDGHRTVGAGGDYQTIQAAWNAVDYDTPACIEVRCDYDPTAEDYPLVLRANSAESFKPLRLYGQGFQQTAIGHPDVTGDVMKIIGCGAADYTRPVHISGLRFVGAQPDDDGEGAGLSIADAPHSIITDCVFTTQNYGLEVCKGDWGCYGLDVARCQAWNCGDDGFKMNPGGNPHNTTFVGCKAIANGGAGFNWLGGTNGTILGGDVELNGGFGVVARNAASLTIGETYVEGNARSESFPVEIYGKNAGGLTVRSSYFNGINPRGADGHDYDLVQRAVNVHDSEAVSVRDCTWQNYGGQFYVGFGDTTQTLHEGTHYAMDDTPLASS